MSKAPVIRQYAWQFRDPSSGRAGDLETVIVWPSERARPFYAREVMEPVLRRS